MTAGLMQIDRDIADVEGRISAKNEKIMSRLRMGDDTLVEEKQVGAMNRDLQGMQGMQGAPRTIVSGLCAPFPPLNRRVR